LFCLAKLQLRDRSNSHTAALICRFFGLVFWTHHRLQRRPHRRRRPQHSQVCNRIPYQHVLQLLANEQGGGVCNRRRAGSIGACCQPLLCCSPSPCPLHRHAMLSEWSTYGSCIYRVSTSTEATQAFNDADAGNHPANQHHATCMPVAMRLRAAICFHFGVYFLCFFVLARMRSRCLHSCVFAPFTRLPSLHLFLVMQHVTPCRPGLPWLFSRRRLSSSMWGAS
jgi:hypothetical protein